MARMDDAERVIWELNQTILRLEAERDRLRDYNETLRAILDRSERRGDRWRDHAIGSRGEGDRPAAHRTEWWDADDFADPERGEGDR